MTKTEGKAASAAVKEILLSNPDGLRDVIRAVMQEVLEAEMDETLGASKSERTVVLQLHFVADFPMGDCSGDLVSPSPS